MNEICKSFIDVSAPAKFHQKNPWTLWTITYKGSIGIIYS